MVLNLGEKESLFTQTDVRETPTDKMVQGNFNIDDFLITNGIVNLKNKTSYWSCTGANFNTKEEGDAYSLDASGYLGEFSTEATETILAQVNLPHGAVITGAIVQGNNFGTRTWTLYKSTLTGSEVSAMASAEVGTEDTTISNATIDNSLYSYFFAVPVGINDNIFGARITYTTDYD